MVFNELKQRNSADPYRDLVVSKGYLVFFSIAPFSMPLLVVAAFVVCLIIGIAIGGSSGGAAGSNAGGGGALFGLAIGGFFGYAGAVAVYLYAPILAFGVIFLLYIAISALQEALGIRIVVPFGQRYVSLKIASLLCFLLIGVVSILVYAVSAEFFGASRSQLENALWHANITFDERLNALSMSYSSVTRQVNAYGLIAVVAVVASTVWFLLINVGVNYFLSRSIVYCVGVFVTAFFLDTAFTALTYLAIGRGFWNSGFLDALNIADSWLREAVLLPVAFLFSPFIDMRDLIASIANLFSVVFDFLGALIEIGLAIVTPEDLWLWEEVRALIEYSRFLQVDFLFFLIASVIWWWRLKHLTK